MYIKKNKSFNVKLSASIIKKIIYLKKLLYCVKKILKKCLLQKTKKKLQKKKKLKYINFHCYYMKKKNLQNVSGNTLPTWIILYTINYYCVAQIYHEKNYFVIYYLIKSF